MIPDRVAQLATWLLRWRVVLPVVVTLFSIYLGVLHPWLIGWGATAEDQQMVLPGDDRTPHHT